MGVSKMMFMRCVRCGMSSSAKLVRMQRLAKSTGEAMQKKKSAATRPRRVSLSNARPSATVRSLHRSIVNSVLKITWPMRFGLHTRTRPGIAIPARDTLARRLKRRAALDTSSSGVIDDKVARTKLIQSGVCCTRVHGKRSPGGGLTHATLQYS